jgi:hypothetical protein
MGHGFTGKQFKIQPTVKKPFGVNVIISSECQTLSVASIPERKQITDRPRKRWAEARRELQTVHFTAAAEEELHPVNIEIRGAKLLLRSV